MRILLIAALILLGAGLAGCARFPELDAAVTEQAKQAERPRLSDNRIVLEPADTLVIDAETQAEMAARSAAMAARAEAAAAPVVPPKEAAALLDRAAALRAEAARVAPEG